MKSDKYFIFCICIIKLLKTFTTNSVIKIMKENMTVTRDPTKFYFNFDWPKDVDENLKHEIEFIIKGNVSLAKRIK